jgi:hypothetical protein
MGRKVDSGVEFTVDGSSGFFLRLHYVWEYKTNLPIVRFPRRYWILRNYSTFMTGTVDRFYSHCSAPKFLDNAAYDLRFRWLLYDCKVACIPKHTVADGLDLPHTQAKMGRIPLPCAASPFQTMALSEEVHIEYEKYWHRMRSSSSASYLRQNWVSAQNANAIYNLRREDRPAVLAYYAARSKYISRAFTD